MSKPIPSPPVTDCKEQVLLYAHILDSLIHELKSMSIEQKHTIDHIRDRQVELE